MAKAKSGGDTVLARDTSNNLVHKRKLSETGVLLAAGDCSYGAPGNGYVIPSLDGVPEGDLCPDCFSGGK